MAYLDRQTPTQRLANLGTAGLIELAIGAALIAGLSITVPIDTDPPPITASNIPDDPPTVPPPDPLDNPVPPPLPQAPPIPKIPLTQDPQPIPTSVIVDPFPDPVPTARADPPPRPTPAPLHVPRAAVPKGNPGNWVTTDDYPSRDLREGNQGVTRFRVRVGTDGRAKNCEITQSSGFASLDNAACARIMSRAKFEPATDENGAKVIGTYANSVRWQIPRQGRD